MVAAGMGRQSRWLVYSAAVPIYEYRCENGHLFEVMQRITDDPVTACEVCGAPVQRVFHPIAVHFKGSGFYNTDYGTAKRRRENQESKSSSSSDSGSDSKPSEKKSDTAAGSGSTSSSSSSSDKSS
jgi:putative FmdB family regulatory protein